MLPPERTSKRVYDGANRLIRRDDRPPVRLPKDSPVIASMIDLHYWPTPNGHKITMFLEEAGLPYTIVPVNIGSGEQFKPDFLTISPNNRMPAIVDHDPADGGAPISLFESGAILLYLAEKTGRFIAADLRGRAEVMQWLFWQMGGARADGRPEPPLPQLRAGEAALRDRPLRQRDATGSTACSTRAWPTATSSPATTTRSPTWRPIRGSCPTSAQGQNLDDFPNLKRWFDAIKARPATVRAYELTRQVPATRGTMDEEAKKILFGQTARSIQRT